MTTAVRSGRYTLDERIASGGMGEVWRGTDTALERTVAIKMLRPSIADDESFRTRFEAEAQHAAALHDPHIATVFDYGDDVDTATGRHSTYLVMELVDGVPLSELIKQPLAPERAAALIAQAAQGLAVAHEAGIVHRDVKPANFLVTREGRVKITDFGIARARGAASLTDTGTIMGTPHYVAPEVAEGREATPASDLYSLGIVLYEALSAAKPFTGDTPIAVALAHLRDEARPLSGSVPPRLRAIVESMMAKDPAMRPPDAATVAAALQAVAAGPDGHPTTAVPAAALDAGLSASSTQVMPALAPETAPADEVSEPPRRRRFGALGWLPVAAGVVVFLLLVAIAYAVGRGGDSPANQDRTAAGAGQTHRSATTARHTQAPAGITVDPNAYVGRPFPEVEKELKGLGLEVEKQSVDGGEKDIVAGLAPSGTLQEGTTVVVSVFKGSHEGSDQGNQDGNGNGHDGHHPSKPGQHKED